MTEIVELSANRNLVEPLVLAGFAVNRRAGRLPYRTLTYLIDKWSAERFATIDVEGAYDLTTVRPQTRWEGDVRVVEWPAVNLFVARPADRHILLLVANEPNFRWKALCADVIGYLDSLGARQLVVLRAFPGSVPHTRPAPIVTNGSDRERAAVFGARPSGKSYRGPTDVGSVLSAKAESLGWMATDLSVLQPLYLPPGPNPMGMLALIQALDRGLGTVTSVDSLKDAVEAQLLALEDQLDHSEENRSALSDLEASYDAGFKDLEASGETSTDLPSTEELLRQVDDLFRGNPDGPPSD